MEFDGKLQIKYSVWEYKLLEAVGELTHLPWGYKAVHLSECCDRSAPSELDLSCWSRQGTVGRAQLDHCEIVKKSEHRNIRLNLLIKIGTNCWCLLVFLSQLFFFENLQEWATPEILNKADYYL